MMRAILLLLALLLNFSSANIFRDAWSLRKGLYNRDNKGDDSLSTNSKDFGGRQLRGPQQLPIDGNDDDSDMFLKMSTCRN